MENNVKLRDHLITAVAGGGFIRIIAAETTDICEDSRKIHGTSAVATAALGRALTGAALMSSQLKNETDSLTFTIHGHGPLGTVTCVSDVHANVRGYAANPKLELPIRTSDGKLDVGKAIGKGYITIIKDLSLKEPYMGTSELISGEIAEDLAYYFQISEQVPSVVALGVRIAPDPYGKENFVVEKAGGYLAQLLPGAPEEIISKLEQNASMLPSVTTLLSAGATMTNIVEDLTRGMELEIKSVTPCAYKCTCSRERMLTALSAIGRKDLQEIADDGKGAELVCHFCNTKYNFDDSEIKQLLR